MAPRSFGGAAVLAYAVVVALGCRAHAAPEPDAGGPGAAGQPVGAQGTAGDAPAPSALPPRRPTRRYYLARTSSGCSYYTTDGDTGSRPVVTPCPAELRPGERLRITGRVCMRESDDKDREQPVVCPDPLTNLEKHELAVHDAGSPAP